MFQLFLILQNFVKPQSLITVHFEFVVCGDMNPGPAKITQRGTWEMKCGLVRKLVKDCNLEINFKKIIKKIEGRVLQDVKEWNFLVMFKFNGKSKFDTVVTIQMLREPLAQ